MTKPTDVMIDLETLGKKPGCIVLSIGACTFNRFSGEIFNTFYAEINRDASAAIGLTDDPDTIAWWQKQGEEARMLIARTGTEESATPEHATECFVTWYKEQAKETRLNGIWANDPSFDCAILSHVIESVGLKTPWPFWAERSCRTTVDIGLLLNINPKKTLTFFGTPHHALDDAKHQAQYVSIILNTINSQISYTASLEEDKRGLLSSKAFLTIKAEEAEANDLDSRAHVAEAEKQLQALTALNERLKSKGKELSAAVPAEDKKLCNVAEEFDAICEEIPEQSLAEHDATLLEQEAKVFAEAGASDFSNGLYESAKGMREASEMLATKALEIREDAFGPQPANVIAIDVSKEP